MTTVRGASGALTPYVQGETGARRGDEPRGAAADAREREDALNTIDCSGV